MASPLLLFFSLLLIHIIIPRNANSLLHSDKEILLKLKDSMVLVNSTHNNGSSSRSLEDWSPANINSHCNFTGVTCNDASRVVSLNLTFVPLFGSLPPEIGLLTSLETLILAADNLTGSLPVEISSLVSLKHLNISNNNFTGEFPGVIFTNMSQLEVFDVYNNYFNGTLPEEIVRLRKLSHLCLGGNFFSGEIPESYSEITSLTFLGLNGNSLSGRVPASLSSLPNLKELYLGYFNTYDGGIPPEFGEFKSLQKLDMASCNISGEIPKTLGNLTSLNSLFLQENKLTGEIPPELSGMVSLMSLDLSLNSLAGEIPASFSLLKNFTLINLFKNNLYGRIPPFIGDLPNLEVLQLWNNNFTFELPENLGRNGRFLLLDVTSNHLTGEIPRDLCKSGRLKWLMLTDNALFGSVPEELGGCHSLQRVRIGGNQLSGKIPAGIFTLPKVEIVEMNDNSFSGELPPEMSGDTIGTLDLSNNFIAGAIPPAVRNMRNLQKLLLQNNRFSGEIPGELFGLKKLQTLNLRANNLSGGIPAEVGECSSLMNVDFSRNSLAGEIPTSVTRLRDLESLNLSTNSLTGEIPEEISSFASLSVLDLSNNDFYGRVPSGGHFDVFKQATFAGNPHLCWPHHEDHPCPTYPPLKHSHNKTTPLTSSKLIILIIALTTLILLSLVTLIILRRKRLEGSRMWKVERFQKLDFKAEDVIEWLKEDNVIGKGGAGTVYRGTMPDGTDVAIKRLAGRGGGGPDQCDRGFGAEIATLGRIRHRNIVRLLGYVCNRETNLLVYEYMHNGSLGEKLHGPKGAHLHWEMRYKIAVEAAKGLCYLHHDCSPKIFHRDVKSNNILLDSDYEAHVADFGLAKFLRDAGGGGGSECMSAIAGSYGYIAPEYAYTLKVDEKSDVYSFGVVLLELITGRRPVGDFGEGVDIVRWVKMTESELPKRSDTATVLAILDSRLAGYQLTSVINLFKVAMLCVEDESSDRPTMREVVHMLTNPPSPQIETTLDLI